MRRVLFVALGLLMLGLATAFAANFDVQAEDVQSFTTPVSISVPEPPPATTTIYIRGEADTLPGFLQVGGETPSDSVRGREIENDPATVLAQADVAKFHTWQSLTATGAGLAIDGHVTLLIHQDGVQADRLTAGLLSCPAAAPPASTSCSLLAVGVAAPNSGPGNGFKERVVDFGTLDTTITAGNQLRLKIVNRDEQPPGTVVSGNDWSVQWGHLPSRSSRIVITPP